MAQRTPVDPRPRPKSYPRPGPLERYNANHRKDPDGCWRWTAALGTNGYVSFKVGGRLVKVHRWAYEQFVGPIPDGLTIDHLCRVRHCVNPAHMEPVPAAVNKARADRSTQRARNAAQTHCRNGHPFDAANTMVSRDRWTHRACKTCHRQNEAARRVRARDAA